MCWFVVFSSRRRQTRFAVVTGVQTLALPISPEDEPRMLMLTQQLFGSTDPDLNRSREAITSAEQAIAMLNFVIADFEQYFGALTADRRANPREDIDRQSTRLNSSH